MEKHKFNLKLIDELTLYKGTNGKSILSGNNRAN